MNVSGPSSAGLSDISWQAREQSVKDLSFYPEPRELALVASDVNSAGRNTLSVIQGLTSLPGITGLVVGASSVVGGVLGVPLGLAGLRFAVKKGKGAVACGDREGVMQSLFWGAFGGAYTGVSGVLATGGVMTLKGAGMSASMVSAFGGLGFAMYTASLAHSGYGWRACQKFSKALNAPMNDEARVQWLRDQVELTQTEEEQLSSMNVEEKEKAAAQILHKKWNALERRVGAEGVSMIREAFTTKSSINASELFAAVREANFREKVKHILIFFISLIGLAAFIAMFVSLGPMSPLLFALTAISWLLIDSSRLHKWVGDKCWNWHSKGNRLEGEPSDCQTPLLTA